MVQSKQHKLHSVTRDVCHYINPLVITKSNPGNQLFLQVSVIKQKSSKNYLLTHF